MGLAGARAAASLSLTIAVAFATLLVVGGILAGPAIRSCWGDTGRIGACLHNRLEQGGLLPATPEPAQVPVLPAQAPPQIVAEMPPHHSGWIEANATEYEPAPVANAVLSAPSGSIAVDGIAIAPADAAAEARLTAALGDLETTGSVLVPPGPVAVVDLAPPPGQLTTGGSAPLASPPVADVALVERAGQLSAGGEAVAVAPSGDAMLAPLPAVLGASGSSSGSPSLMATAEPLAVVVTPPRPIMALPETGGSIGSGPNSSGEATLEATAKPIAPPTTPAPPSKVTAKPSPIKPGPAATPNPKAIIKFNRRYPDVVVLPKPNSGKASSFSTLQLR